MNSRHVMGLFAVCIAAAVLFPAGLLAAPTKEKLKESFKSRHGKLVALKASGRIGETHLGFIEGVNSGTLSGAHKKLVAEENADRNELYGILAAEEETTPDVVANRNAIRNFGRAKSGEFLKTKEGWRKKP